MNQHDIALHRPLGAKDAAKYLGISESYLYRLTSQGKIGHFKSSGGKLLYFRVEDLDSWAFGSRIKSADEIDQEAATRLVLSR